MEHNQNAQNNENRAQPLVKAFRKSVPCHKEVDWLNQMLYE